MGSLFTGTPQAATSYTTTTSESPKWMQDAIYNQLQWAQNIANKPYESFDLPSIAELSPLQQQAYTNIENQQGAYKADMDTATTGMTNLTKANTADALRSAQGDYLRKDLVGQNLDAGQDLFEQAANIDIIGSAQPLYDEAATSARNIVRAGKGYLEQAANMGAADAANPYLQFGLGQSGMGAANPFLLKSQEATAAGLSDKALQASDPFVQSAAQTSVSDVSNYMNPYQTNVMDVIAQQGARNLSENLLPQVSDSFIRAGQYGSSQMGEMGARALRDTQEAILKQQAPLAASGYEAAMRASQADKARQAQLASTVGGIAAGDLSRLLSGAGQYGTLGTAAGQMTGADAGRALTAGSTMGQLTGADAARLAGIGDSFGRLTTSQAGQQAGLGRGLGDLSAQQQSAYANLGAQRTGAGETQQRFGLDAATAAQRADTSDYNLQMAALNNLASLSSAEQGMAYKDIAALEAAGQSQQDQLQREMSAAEKEWMDEQLYQKRQMDWLGTQVRGTAPITPLISTVTDRSVGKTYSPSPLSQLATGLGTYKALNTS
jgi:hypothetical protein|tara:strand:- start:1126 stop:2775 length:1650 start_codon:yes stop_codon:yes gene_type:complete